MDKKVSGETALK